MRSFEQVSAGRMLLVYDAVSSTGIWPITAARYISFAPPRSETASA